MRGKQNGVNGAIGGDILSIGPLFPLLLLLLLPSCSLDPLQPFRVGTNVWPGYEPLYLARELGEYDGKSIRLVEFSNTTEVIQALRNEVLEAAALTLDEALNVIQDGLDLKIVLVMDYSRGGDALVVNPRIEQLTDLQGKRIGVENTAVGAVMLEEILQRAGLQLSDISLLPVTVDQHSDAYREGAIEALITFDPARSLLLDQGAHVLWDSSEIPNRIVDVLVVRNEAIPGREETVQHLLEGYFNALQFQQSEAQRAAEIMQARMGLSREEVMEAFLGLYQPDLTENHELLTGAQHSELQATLDYLSDLMLEQGLLEIAPATDAILEGRWLPQQSN